MVRFYRNLGYGFFLSFLAVVNCVRYIYKVKIYMYIFLVKLNYLLSPCSVKPALVDTDLHVHSASAQGKVSGGRGEGGSYYFVH